MFKTTGWALKDKIEHYVERVTEGGCWIWIGSISPEGYARLHKGGSPKQGHRISYEIHKGEIPKGFDLDHLCRVRCCVNPDHLEPVTRKENLNRGIRWKDRPCA
jgi:HNH endonuclease